MMRKMFTSSGKRISALAVLVMLGWLCAATAMAANVTEPLIIGSGNIDTANPGNEPTQRATPPSTGSGFRWGGFNAGTSDVCEFRSGAPGQIRFKGGANTHGSYVYTIFDSTGAQPPVSPAVVSNLYRITFTSGDVQSGQQVRLMVRRANAASAHPNQEWYVSEPISVPDDSTHAILVSSVQWAALTAPSNAVLNPLAANDEAAISFGALGSWASTGVTDINGGGIYVESGNGGHWRFQTSVLWEEAPPPLPIIATIANQDAAANHLYAFTPSLSFDAATPGQVWTLIKPSPMMGDMAFNTSNGRITWTPQVADIGTLTTFTLGVSNDHGAAVNNVSWNVTVFQDQARVINPVFFAGLFADAFVVGGNATAPDARARYRQAMSVMGATDLAPVTTWTLTVAPHVPGTIAIDTQTGLIDGRPAFADVGTTFTFNVVAKNIAGSSLTKSWKLKVVPGVAEPFLQVVDNTAIIKGGVSNGAETIRVPNGVDGPGFGWGGYIENFASLASKTIQFDKEDTGDLEFAQEINVAGDYAYTIFDKLSDNPTSGTFSAADTSVTGMDQGGAIVINVRTTDIGGQSVSCLLRDKNNQWFRSNTVSLHNVENGYVDVVVSNFAPSAWSRVGSAAETDLNLLNNGGSVTLGSGSGTPDFSVVTGGGLAIVATNTNGINDLEINQISWAGAGAIPASVNAVMTRNWILYE
jgi:hypothetical protein